MNQTLEVALAERSYPIHIDAGLIARAGGLIAPKLPVPRVIIITDEQVAEHFLRPLQASLDKADIRYEAIIVPPGEDTKSFKQLQEAAEAILAQGIERGVTLIALGGGVIGDFTGFLASILLRGIPFIQVPTTLLAMVDSAVGGKTAINSKAGKNLIGSFYQPRMVLADSDALQTLPKREFLAGLAEVIKYGVIGDRAFFDWIASNLDALLALDKEALHYAIYTSCKHKAEIVAADETEKGKRALLNLGHTFGHALEAETGYSNILLHGEAVSIGMVLALQLSVKLGYCEQTDVDALMDLLQRAGMPHRLQDINQPFEAEALLAHMYKDKKVEQQKLVFILARSIGECFIDKQVSPSEIIDVLNEAIDG